MSQLVLDSLASGFSIVTINEHFLTHIKPQMYTVVSIHVLVQIPLCGVGAHIKIVLHHLLVFFMIHMSRV